MTKKRFEIDDDDEYLIDNKTGKLYDACGGGDGFPFIINEYDKLEKENKQLKMENNELKLLVQNWESLDEEKDEQLDKQNQALKKLKKENEQLKQSNQKLNDELQETIGYLALKSGVEKENEQLKSENEDMRRLINNISHQRDEFHRGARENANRVGKLKKENEQLKHKLKSLSDNFNHLKRLFDEIEEPISDELLAEYSRIVVEGFE